MNDFMYDPMAAARQAAQQAADPMAVRQPMPIAGVQSKMGLVANPFAPMSQNAAVYNNAGAIGTGIAMYGTAEMRQNSVAYMKGDLDNDGTLNDYEANRQAKIDEAMAQQK